VHKYKGRLGWRMSGNRNSSVSNRDWIGGEANISAQRFTMTA